MPTGKYFRTVEHKQKISAILKGKCFSKEHKQKISSALKGKQVSEKTRLKMSETRKQMGIKPPSNLGKSFSKEHKLKISQSLKNNKNSLGNKHSSQWKKDNSLRNKGSNCTFWKGGITPINQLIRLSAEYKEWRLQIFGRDNFTCQECGKRGVYLEAHHKLKFSEYPEKRFDLNNGITLCRKCHNKTKNKKGVPIWSK